MNRRAFIVGGVVAIGAPVVTAAQTTRTTYRIGVLTGASPDSPPFKSFIQALAELGWADGQNVVIESRFAAGRNDRLPALAAELVELKVDVMAAGPTPPALAAKKATKTIPIVMLGAAEPVELGLVESLARPGGNVTGLAWSVNLEIIGKGIEILRETFPKARLVGVLYNPVNPAQPLAIRDNQSAFRSI